MANISDSLAVETAVDTVRVTSSIAPATKSKTEKRDSSDQIGESGRQYNTFQRTEAIHILKIYYICRANSFHTQGSFSFQARN